VTIGHQGSGGAVPGAGERLEPGPAVWYHMTLPGPGNAGAGEAGDLRLSIGTEDGCEHDLRRLGTDVGRNVYLECRRCEGVVVESGPPGETRSREKLDRESRETNSLTRQFDRGGGGGELTGADAGWVRDRVDRVRRRLFGDR